MTNTTPTIRSIRARAKKILADAGIAYAKSYPSRIRGWRIWDRGVTINEDYRKGVLAQVYAHNDYSPSRVRDQAQAVAVLRAAGWEVADNGDITKVPEAT